MRLTGTRYNFVLRNRFDTNAVNYAVIMTKIEPTLGPYK